LRTHQFYSLFLGLGSLERSASIKLDNFMNAGWQLAFITKTLPNLPPVAKLESFFLLWNAHKILITRVISSAEFTETQWLCQPAGD
jgi:hypothetical protein